MTAAWFIQGGGYKTCQTSRGKTKALSLLFEQLGWCIFFYFMPASCSWMTELAHFYWASSCDTFKKLLCSCPVTVQITIIIRSQYIAKTIPSINCTNSTGHTFVYCIAPSLKDTANPLSHHFNASSYFSSSTQALAPMRRILFVNFYLKCNQIQFN